MNMSDLHGQAALYLMGHLPPEEIKAFEDSPDHCGATSRVAAFHAPMRVTGTASVESDAVTSTAMTATRGWPGFRSR